jgi:hypothetical protein
MDIKKGAVCGSFFIEKQIVFIMDKIKRYPNGFAMPAKKRFNSTMDTIKRGQKATCQYSPLGVTFQFHNGYNQTLK